MEAIRKIISVNKMLNLMRNKLPRRQEIYALLRNDARKTYIQKVSAICRYFSAKLVRNQPRVNFIHGVNSRVKIELYAPTVQTKI